MNNESRERSGFKALVQFAGTRHDLDTAAETVGIDVISNILHYAASVGWDVERVHRLALEHFEAERGPEPATAAEREAFAQASRTVDRNIKKDRKPTTPA